MSKPVTPSNLFSQLRQTNTNIQRLQRTAQATTLKDVDTTGLTSAQIDATVFPSGNPGVANTSQPSNGITVTDTTNNLLLVRQGGKWAKTSLTVID